MQNVLFYPTPHEIAAFWRTWKRCKVAGVGNLGRRHTDWLRCIMPYSVTHFTPLKYEFAPEPAGAKFNVRPLAKCACANVPGLKPDTSRLLQVHEKPRFEGGSDKKCFNYAHRSFNGDVQRLLSKQTVTMLTAYWVRFSYGAFSIGIETLKLPRDTGGYFTNDPTFSLPRTNVNIDVLNNSLNYYASICINSNLDSVSWIK